MPLRQPPNTSLSEELICSQDCVGALQDLVVRVKRFENIIAIATMLNSDGISTFRAFANILNTSIDVANLLTEIENIDTTEAVAAMAPEERGLP